MPIKCVEDFKNFQHRLADQALAAMDDCVTAGWANLRAEVMARKTDSEVVDLGFREYDPKGKPRDDKRE